MRYSTFGQGAGCMALELCEGNADDNGTASKEIYVMFLSGLSGLVVFEYIGMFYHRIRRHAKIGNQIPADFASVVLHS